MVPARTMHITAMLMPMLLLAATLPVGGPYLNGFYRPLFAMVGVCCIALIVSGSKHGAMEQKLNNPGLQPGAISHAAWLLPLWGGYILLHGILSDNTNSLPALALAAVLLGAPGLKAGAMELKSKSLSLAAIKGLALLQALTAIGQWLAGQTPHGTWPNPNITAMAISLAVPAAWPPILAKGRGRFWHILLLALLALALLLLRCRTAWMGAALASALMLEWRYGWLRRHWAARRHRWILLLSAVALLGMAAYGLYRIKQSSAEGRWLIWRLSTQLAAQRPWTGHGYGGFERHYNLLQAEYFGSGQGSERQAWLAGHTTMPYNELLGHAVEGGLPGLLLATLALAGLPLLAWRRLYRKPVANRRDKTGTGDPAEHCRQEQVTAAVALLCIPVMSMVNFTVTALPLLAIWAVYAAISLAPMGNGGQEAVTNRQNLTGKQMHQWRHWRKLGHRCQRVITLALALWLGIHCIGLAKLQRATARAAQLGMARQYAAGLATLKEVPSRHRHCGDYWMTLANLHYFNGHKALALPCYQKAAGYLSTPALYQQLGNCQLAQGQYAEATQSYLTALHIQPHRFAPRYLLMLLCAQQKDRAGAIRWAREILNMEAKVPSERVEFYREKAGEVMEQLKVEN
jgi:O-antigen polymerase